MLTTKNFLYFFPKTLDYGYKFQKLFFIFSLTIKLSINFFEQLIELDQNFTKIKLISPTIEDHN
jgi:hypothetical protein